MFLLKYHFNLQARMLLCRRHDVRYVTDNDIHNYLEMNTGNDEIHQCYRHVPKKARNAP